jgi:DNA repair protein RadC
LLELLLMLGIPRRDVKPLAKDIIDRFNDFAGVVSADVERLRSIPGLGDTAVAAIKLAQASSLRLLRERAVGRDTISSWT